MYKKHRGNLILFLKTHILNVNLSEKTFLIIKWLRIKLHKFNKITVLDPDPFLGMTDPDTFLGTTDPDPFLGMTDLHPNKMETRH